MQEAKTAVADVLRRFDGQSPDDQFATKTTVLADVLADLVLAVTKDEQHAYRLFTIIGAKIEGRWRILASTSAP
jgi:hypothetical protein